MAKKTARRPADPTTMPLGDLEALIREAERKIDLMERFAESEEWRLITTHRERRRDTLQHEHTGLLRRIARPVKDQPPVTLEQIACLQARADENTELLNFPTIIVAQWRQQRDELHRVRLARASSGG